MSAFARARRASRLSTALATGLFLSACAQRTPPAVPNDPRSSTLFEEHALRAQAARTEAEAAHAEGNHAPSFVKDLQVSTGNLRGTDIRDGAGTRVALRVGFERPWQMSQVKSSLRAEHDAAALAAAVAGNQGAVDTCGESADAHVLAGQRPLYDVYRGQLTEIARWAESAVGADAIEPLSGARARLFIERHLWSDMPSPVVQRAHESFGVLPEVVEHDGRLARDPAFLRMQVAGRPEVNAHVASARQRDALAAAERGQRMPWLDFVQLGYPAHPRGVRDIQGRIAVSLPVADGSRGRAERQTYLARGERARADVEVARLLRVASVSLDILDRFEEQAPQLLRLATFADESEQAALKFMAGRYGRPDQVAQLLSEVYAVRSAILAARADAARAVCELTRATGVTYASWPRSTGTSTALSLVPD